MAKLHFMQSSDFTRSTFEEKPARNIGQSPAFYIADLNTNNNVYIFFTKAQAIRNHIEQLEDLSPSEIISKINKASSGIRLEPGDAKIIEQVKQQNEALKMVNALYFEANNKPLLEVGGAGGLQYLSEAIAEQDTKLLESIDERQNGALIGIFSLGGGTGSGSLFAILTKYKNTVHRYTVGVGVLPTRQNVNEFSNAGRYLTKYLGAEIKDRFHTLMLFSNEAANDVLMQGNLPDGTDAVKIINGYISAFIHDFSLINDNKTMVEFGKLFDPMDGKNYLKGVCTAGYCAAEAFSAKDFFTKAISPLSYENASLSGLAVRVTREEFGTGQQEEISLLIRRIIDALYEGDEPAGKDIQKLRSSTPFYRTIKSAYVFYFVKNSSYQTPAYTFQRTINQFFQKVSGKQVPVSVNCYYTPESDSRESSVLLMLGGAFNFEIYESVMQYAQRYFIKSGEVEPNFSKAFDGMLDEVKRRESSSIDSEFPESIETVLVDTNCEIIETTAEENSAEIFGHPDLKSVMNTERLERILIKRGTLKAALVEIARNFTLGDNEVPTTGDVFDEF